MGKIKLSKMEERKYLSQDPGISDVMSSLVSHKKLPKSKWVYKDVDYALALARKFNEKVVKPLLIPPGIGENSVRVGVPRQIQLHGPGHHQQPAGDPADGH